MHPEIDYNLVDTEKGLLILASELQDACLARYKLTGTTLASCKGAALDKIAFRHPFYDRTSPVYLGDYVTLDTGTGIVHSSPAYGVEDFDSCRRYGMKDDEILTPVMGDGKYVPGLPLFGGMMIWKANPKIVEAMRERGVLFAAENYVHSYMHCWRHKTPVILRATIQWFAGMDEVPGWQGAKPAEPLRATALRGVENTQFFPAWGQAPPARHDRQPAGLDAVAPAPVGRADAVFHPQGNRPAAPAHARDSRGGGPARRKGRHRGLADRGSAGVAGRRLRDV